MPRVKDLARAILATEWHLPNEAFDILWEQLAAIPRQTTPLGTSVLGQHALAGAGVQPEQVIVAAFIMSQAAQDLPDTPTREQAFAKLDELVALFGQPGIRRRIMHSWETATAHLADTLPNTPAPTAFATLHNHDHPNGTRINEQDAAREQQQREHYQIFLYQERNLPPRSPGRLYTTTPSGQSIDESAHFTLLQYRIIAQLLKHRDRDEERSLPSLVEHAWRNKDAAIRVRQAGKAEEVSSTYRSTLRRLSAITQEFLSVAIKTERSDIYTIIPWPLRYCVIEEQPADQEPTH